MRVNQYMKSLTTWLTFFLVVIFNINSAKATHIVGGDITYRFLDRTNGQNRYEVILTVRRDCSKNKDGKDTNEPFDKNAVITIFKDDKNNKKSVFQILKVAQSSTSSVDDKIESDCGFEGSQICYEQTEYKVIVSLPDNPDGGYIFVYQRCCRNGSINNIINPLNTGATYFAELSKFAFDNRNSSPRFSMWPNVYMCVNEPYNFDFKATDADGDSLVYKLCVPKAGLDSIAPVIADANPAKAPPYPEIIFQFPYNLNNLMGGVPLKIDLHTGKLTATPNIVGQYVLTICVEEYRNGVKIGEVRRDLQYNTRICSTPPTAIVDAPSSLCNTKTISFVNNSVSSDSYEWNFNYPSTDPAFKSTQKNPTFTYPANGDYKVYLKVIRGSDKCFDTLIQDLHITDLPYNADFTYDIKACNPDGSISVILTDSSYTDDPGAFSTEWNWKLIQDGVEQTSSTNPAIFTIQPADFDVELDVKASNACSGSLSESVRYDTKILESDFKLELAGCDENNKLKVKLIDLSQSLNDNYIVTSSDWTVRSGTSTNNFSGDTVEIILERLDFEVELNINTDKFCRSQTVKSFTISDFVPAADFIFELSGCDQENAAIIRFTEQADDNLPYSSISNFSWTYDTGNGTGKMLDLVRNLKDSFDMKLKLTFANNCTSEITKSIDIDELRPKLGYNYLAEDCPTDSTVALKFNYNDDFSKNLNNDGIKWNIGNITNIQSFNGTIILVNVPKDSTIYTSLNTQFENGCRDTLEAQFTPGPYATLHIIADSLVLCPGETKQLLENVNTNFDYFWSPQLGLDLSDPTKPILTAVEDKVYSVTVTDGLCLVTGKIKVDVLETINLGIEGENFTCDGKVNLTAIGGVGPGQYFWSDQPGFGNEIASGAQLNTTFTDNVKTYYVRFKGDVCSAEPAQIVIRNESPKLEIIGPFEFCIGDTIKTNNVINSDPTHVNTITWKPDPHLISVNDGYKITVGTLGPNDKDFTLFLNATNQFGCAINDSLPFKIIENPIVDFNFDVKSCDTFDVCFQLNGNIFGFPRWDFGDPPSGPKNNSILKADCHTYPGPGDYIIKLINLSEKCPFKDVTDTLTLNASYPVFDGNEVENCINTPYTLNLPQAAQGLDFVWLNSDGTFLSSEANPTVNISRDTFYLLEVKDANGCPFKDTIFVKAFEFDFTLEARDTVCTTGQYPISVVSGQSVNFTYQWSPVNGIVSGQNTPSIIADVAKSGSYQVTLTHPTLGCKQEKSITFNKFEFQYQIQTPPIFCLNQNATANIVVSGDAAYIYDWQPSSAIISGGNTPTATLSITGEQEFFVNVVHPTLGCRLRDSFTVEPSFLTLELEASPNTTVPKGQTVELTIVDPVAGWSYVWSNGATGTKQTVVINDPTDFVVTATDANGCTGTAQIRIDIRPPQCADDVFIPTAFSPNGDDANDVLMVRSNYITEMELIIYNRWGQEVFATKDQAIGWNGRLNGEELSPDVYAYWLKARCQDGEEIIKRGNVSLLR